MNNLLKKVMCVISIISLGSVINVIVAFITPIDEVDPTEAGTYTAGYFLPKYLYDDCRIYSKSELLLAIEGDAEMTTKYTKKHALYVMDNFTQTDPHVKEQWFFAPITRKDISTIESSGVILMICSLLLSFYVFNIVGKDVFQRRKEKAECQAVRKTKTK